MMATVLSEIVTLVHLPCKLWSMFAAAQMDSVTGLYENKPSVTAVFPLLGPEAVEP